MQQTFVPEQSVASILPSRQGSKTVTVETLLNIQNDFFERRTLNWMDNVHLIYSTSLSEKENISNIEILNIHTKEKRILGKGEMPKVSPDNQWVLFIDGKNNNQKLMISKVDGSEKKEIMTLSGYATYSYDYAWSPDSKTIVLSYQPYVNLWVEQDNSNNESGKTSALEAEQLRKPPELTSIYLIDIKTLQARKLNSFDCSIDNISWFPDGKKILFACTKAGFFYNQMHDESSVKSLRISDNHVDTLISFDGLQQFLDPVSSPNGDQVAFMYDADNPEFNYMLSIGLIALKDDLKKIERQTHEIKLFHPRWSPDGKQIYVMRNNGPYQQIYRLDLKTKALTQITKDPITIYHFALSPDGKQLAWIGKDAHDNTIIRVALSNGQNIQDCMIIPNAPKDVYLSEVHEIEWETINYPSKMKGLLIFPKDYKKGMRYPLIVDIHGGGAGASIYMEGGVLNNTPLEWQMWAAKGYAVFVPEFRSSCAFGSLAITRDEKKEHDLINRDVQDITTGVDFLINKGLVNHEKVAIIGHSAGAHRANWLTVSSHRFCTVVSKEGWADDWLRSGALTGFKRIWDIYGGHPALVPENYQKNSAIFHAKGAKTPTLFIMGNPKLGGVDPYDTVKWLYNALKAQNVQTQYIQYPDEGHGLERPENRRDAIERIERWLDNCL